MKKSSIWVLIILMISLGGYALAFWQYQSKSQLEKKLLDNDLQDIGIIDDQIKNIRKEKSITIKELEKSRDNINKLLEEVQIRDTTSLNLDDALKIIEDLQ